MRPHPIRTEGGFSLIELMVALLIGVVLTSGVISVFITSRNSYNLNNAVGQVQEEGRFALSTMQPLIAMAGFDGCSHVKGQNLNSYKTLIGTGDADPVYMVQYGIYGFEYKNTGIGGTYTDPSGQTPAVAASASEWTYPLSTTLFNALSTVAAPVVKYSDILIIHEGQANPAPILADGTTVGPLTYTTSNAPAMAAGALAVASDCSDLTNSLVTAFQITSMTSGSLNHAMSGSPGNVATIVNFNPAGKKWPNTFSPGTGTVTPELTYVFYIGKSNVDQGTSLYWVQMNPTTGALLGAPQELVPGVENMQLLYGVDTDGDQIPNIYETADVISNDAVTNIAGLATPGPPDGSWAGVVSVRVALVVHSDNNSIENNTSVTTTAGTKLQLTNTVSQTFYMLGTTATDSFTYKSFADRRLRRLFQETFSVRSQLP